MSEIDATTVVWRIDLHHSHAESILSTFFKQCDSTILVYKSNDYDWEWWKLIQFSHLSHCMSKTNATTVVWRIDLHHSHAESILSIFFNKRETSSYLCIKVAIMIESGENWHPNPRSYRIFMSEIDATHDGGLAHWFAPLPCRIDFLYFLQTVRQYRTCACDYDWEWWKGTSTSTQLFHFYIQNRYYDSGLAHQLTPLPCRIDSQY